MTSTLRMSLRGAALVAAVVVITGLPVDMGIVTGPAQAIVGRPLTPVSVAGVARRTTRRTVAYTAAATPAPVYVAPVYAAPPPPPRNCVTSYNSYGQSVTTCN
jgi:hypothetical protein